MDFISLSAPKKILKPFWDSHDYILLSVLHLSDNTPVTLQDDSGMPMGMSSLLTAPLVADNVVEDSVSFNLALYNLKSLGFAPF